MWRVLFEQQVRQHPKFGTWYGRAQGQPGWVVRTTIGVMVLIVVVPLVALVILAAVAGLVTFASLSVVSLVTEPIRKGLHGGGRTPATPVRDDAGRRNVRIIREG